jgi:hypothetical protein
MHLTVRCKLGLKSVIKNRKNDTQGHKKWHILLQWPHILVHMCINVFLFICVCACGCCVCVCVRACACVCVRVWIKGETEFILSCKRVCWKWIMRHWDKVNPWIEQAGKLDMKVHFCRFEKKVSFPKLIHLNWA